MGTNRNIGRNNVVFDILRPSCRKRDDSQRKHTNLFFMLAVFAQCSHPDFHPSVSVSLCEDLSLNSVSPVLFLFLFIYFFSPKGDSIWPSVSFTGILHQMCAHRFEVTLHHHLSAHGRDAIFCVYILWRIPLFLLADCRVHMHSWLQMLSIKSCKTHSGTSLEGLLPLPLSHLRTSCQLTSPLP